jgi:hypothetical protein
MATSHLGVPSERIGWYVRRRQMSKRAPLIWIDDAGNGHLAPNMNDLPLKLQESIKEMASGIAVAVALIRNGKQPTKRQAEQLVADAEEAVNILLRMLFIRIPQEEIEQREWSEKLQFVVRWLDLQGIPFALAA